MIREIQVENFKSIKKMTLKLGRVNVFIGENGSGKSNILEAIALAGAAAADKLDNEFLASRGIRTAEANHMRCAFSDTRAKKEIEISILSEDKSKNTFNLAHDGKPYSSWKCEKSSHTNIKITPDKLIATLNKIKEINKGRSNNSKEIDNLIADLQKLVSLHSSEKSNSTTKTPATSGIQSDDKDEGDPIKDFVIYSPENQSLRLFQKEGQIEPLGIQGEGLLKFLKVLSETPEYSTTFQSIRQRLRVLGWFEDFRVPDSKSTAIVRRIEIQDRFLSSEAGSLDQVSANEGFLFLLFYFSLFSTKLTPRFFAIDNVDASLNPKLCAHLVIELVKLAQENDKQVILTTHNPATLDGLNLNDDEQRLFVISRRDDGETRIRRIRQKEGPAQSIKLSTAFINGFLGGLPEGF